jgi:hypothetical protein
MSYVNFCTARLLEQCAIAPLRHGVRGNVLEAPQGFADQVAVRLVAAWDIHPQFRQTSARLAISSARPGRIFCRRCFIDYKFF